MAPLPCKIPDIPAKLAAASIRLNRRGRKRNYSDASCFHLIILIRLFVSGLNFVTHFSRIDNHILYSVGLCAHHVFCSLLLVPFLHSSEQGMSCFWVHVLLKHCEFMGSSTYWKHLKFFPCLFLPLQTTKLKKKEKKKQKGLQLVQKHLHKSSCNAFSFHKPHSHSKTKPLALPPPLKTRKQTLTNTV